MAEVKKPTPTYQVPLKRVTLDVYRVEARNPTEAAIAAGAAAAAGDKPWRSSEHGRNWLPPQKEIPEDKTFAGGKAGDGA